MFNFRSICSPQIWASFRFVARLVCKVLCRVSAFGFTVWRCWRKWDDWRVFHLDLGSKLGKRGTGGSSWEEEEELGTGTGTGTTRGRGRSPMTWKSKTTVILFVVHNSLLLLLHCLRHNIYHCTVQPCLCLFRQYFAWPWCSPLFAFSFLSGTIRDNT